MPSVPIHCSYRWYSSFVPTVPALNAWRQRSLHTSVFVPFLCFSIATVAVFLFSQVNICKTIYLNQTSLGRALHRYRTKVLGSTPVQAWIIFTFSFTTASSYRDDQLSSEWSIYEIIHIWTAVVDESEGWSSQLIFQLKQLERRSLKKNQGFNGIRTRDLREYRCDALPTELWSHTLGARSVEFIISRGVKWCEV